MSHQFLGKFYRLRPADFSFMEYFLHPSTKPSLNFVTSKSRKNILETTPTTPPPVCIIYFFPWIFPSQNGPDFQDACYFELDHHLPTLDH